MNAAIIGYGKSGAAAEKLLKSQGISSVEIFDDNEALGRRKISLYADSYDVTVLSPGVDVRKYPNIKNGYTSEIELAWKHAPRNAAVIAVTGTNGKSTTAHLTAQILNNSGVKAVACGNIGLPFAEAVADDSVRAFVVELSSFQIDLLREFSADAACVTNVTPDHLDRYGDLNAYYSSKLKLLSFVSMTGLFVCGDDKKVLGETARYPFETLSVDDNFESFPRLEGNVLDFGKFRADVSGFGLFGRHNLTNLAFALELASGVAPFEGDVTRYIEGLTGMPHRTEKVGVYGGVTWINDSKGTNVDSVLTALASAKKPTYLLLGGRDKKSDYAPLAELINKNVSKVCYFGEAASLIHGRLSPLVSAPGELFATLEEAVAFCARDAASGSTVLLSPACSSFDEFKNYEERGREFARYVKTYAQGGPK